MLFTRIKPTRKLLDGFALIARRLIVAYKFEIHKHSAHSAENQLVSISLL
jgi:hypothetical protein